MLRFSTRWLNNICSWYLGLRKSFRSFTIWSHGLAVVSTGKLVVRLGFGCLTNWITRSVADRSQALPAAWWPVMAARTIWRPHAGAGPARQASTASKPPGTRLSRHWAGLSLPLAYSRSFAHCARHRRRSRPVELARIHRHPSLQSAALTAPPHPTPPFPPCCAHSRAIGKPCFALRHRGCVSARAPPWPSSWPRRGSPPFRVIVGALGPP